MKNKAIILFLIYLSVNGTAFEVTLRDGGKFANVEYVEASSVVDGKDLKVGIGLNLKILKNFSEYRDTLTIGFRPWERTHNWPARDDVSFEACFGSAKLINYDAIGMECEGEPLSIVPDNDYDAILTIPPFNESEKFIVVQINYTMPDYIIEQGMYDVIWLHYRNMKCNMKNHVILPLNTSIPYRFPEDAQIDQHRGRWVFTLEGTKDRFIWYTDAEEIKKHEDGLMIRGAFLGALFGFFILLVIERKLTKRDDEKNIEKIEKIIDSKLTRDNMQKIKQSSPFVDLSFAILGYLLLKKSLRDKKKGD